MKIQILGFLSSLLFLILILSLVRSEKLKEEYAIIWIITSLTLIIISLWKASLTYLANLMGIQYGPLAIFLLAIFFIIVLLLHFSVVLTKLSNQMKTIAQTIALIEGAKTEADEKKLK